MKHNSSRVALLALVGLSTVTLFQNCSSGGLPPGLDEVSVSSIKPVVPTLLQAYAMNPNLTVGQTTVITVTGGVKPYTFTVSTLGGVVSEDPVAGFVYTAPAAATSALITVTDATNFGVPVTINVAGVTTTPSPPPPTAQKKNIYSFFDNTKLQHSFADSPTGGFGTLEAARYALLTDGSTGAVQFNRCAQFHNDIKPVTFYYDTAGPCEPGDTATPLGFIFPDGSHEGTVKLYRHRLDFQSEYGTGPFAAMDHYDSLSSDPPAQFWVNEGVFGYVYPPLP